MSVLSAEARTALSRAHGPGDRYVGLITRSVFNELVVARLMDTEGRLTPAGVNKSQEIKQGGAT